MLTETIEYLALASAIKLEQPEAVREGLKKLPNFSLWLKRGGGPDQHTQKLNPYSEFFEFWREQFHPNINTIKVPLIPLKPLKFNIR